MSSSTSALVPYMVLEWLEGRSLAQDFDVRRSRGMTGRTLPEVVKVFDAAAQGLAFAHSQGVVHRDMNPGNLFLADTRQGPTMKVLDFGVAKVVSDHALELGPRAPTLGQIRIFAPAYGAPEQFDDGMGPVGPATDVYSFALILLEALRDYAVRQGEHLGEFAMVALDENAAPTPRALGIPVGDAVEDVFQRAVSMRPQGRPGDMGEFWGGLKYALQSDALSGKPPHANRVASRSGSSWKPHAPAAGQAHPDRSVTADIRAPVIEVSRPGSIAPSPVAPGVSQMLRGTVRMSTGAPPPVSGVGAPSGLLGHGLAFRAPAAQLSAHVDPRDAPATADAGAADDTYGPAASHVDALDGLPLRAEPECAARRITGRLGPASWRHRHGGGDGGSE